MTNVREFLKQTKGTVSRGLPSSRKLHSLEARRANIMAKRDWFDAKREKAEKNAKGDRTLLNRALAGIYFVASKFRPWQKKRQS